MKTVEPGSILSRLFDELHECANCAGVWRDDELEEIKDLSQRVEPCGPVPSGECPECGSLCYPKEKGDS